MYVTNLWVSQAWKKAMDPKVPIRVREHLEPFAGGLPADIVDRIAEKVLLDRFGYNLTEGKLLAVLLIRQVERERTRTPSVHVRLRVPAKTPPTPVFNPVRVIVPRSRPMRLADRRSRKADRIGEHNEARFHQLMSGLSLILIKSLPTIVLNAHASRSDRNDPLRGNIDQRDHHGDDVSLEITTSRGAAVLIYDVKSSTSRAEAFNADIRFCSRRQVDALMKRAIVVNLKRTDGAIAHEVLKDLVRVGLIPAESRLELLNQFVG